MNLFFRKKALAQSDEMQWRAGWQSLLPPEDRNVEITCDGVTMTAYLRVGHRVVMLQDGLLMKAEFFTVCDFFRKAGYKTVWLIRCTQDIAGGYLRRVRTEDGRTRWIWRSPTTNFGRWTSDNYGATILLQTEEMPGEFDARRKVLGRVIWAESADAHRMIPQRTEFITDDTPGTGEELRAWLGGASLGSLRESL